MVRTSLPLATQRSWFTPRALISLTTVGLTALASMLTACWVEPDQSRDWRQPSESPAATATATTPQPKPQPATVAIATGATIVSEPGQGAGVFVEYLGNGAWRIWATCDSLQTGNSCLYDLSFAAEAGARISSQTRFEKGASDSLSTTAGGLQARFSTTTEIDEVLIDLDTPGASLSIEASLDGAGDSRILYWIGPDALHQGAPTNPVIFVPTKS